MVCRAPRGRCVARTQDAMTEVHGHEIHGSDLNTCIRELVKAIAETEYADPVDASILDERRLLRACLDWRVEALIDQS